jgi:aminoglycoside 6'-N-acetyltransferase I
VGGTLRIVSFNAATGDYFAQAAKLLADTFLCWADFGEASKVLEDCAGEGNILLFAVEGEALAGVVGANPQYDGKVWELHPLAVAAAMRGQGVGRKLVAALEREISERGGITVYLGSDDESNATSLSNTDIYENLPQKIGGIQNLRRHPYEFYQKCGYTIVGVVPDANGFGKPDIMMAKRVGR